MAERIALDEAKLGATSRALARATSALNEMLRNSAQMEPGVEPDGHSIVVDCESPTGDPSRTLGVWIDESGISSIGFGDWHTHGDVLTGDRSPTDQVHAVTDLLAAILADEFVLTVDVGGEYPGHVSVLDLRVADALPEELTSKYSPGKLIVKSWSGGADRQVGLSDLSL